MAPGGDAVGFVDGDEGGLALGEHLGKAGDAEALGGDEEEVERAIEVVAAGLAGVVAGEAGVDAGDAEAEVAELGGLVVHEGDEGRDDEGGAGVAGGSASEGWELVAEAFAGSGGHDEEGIATGGCGFADLLLVGAEGSVTEDAVKEFGEGLGWLQRGHCCLIFACPARTARSFAWFRLWIDGEDGGQRARRSGVLLWARLSTGRVRIWSYSFMYW
jgi:hypothetical protein